MSAEELTAVTDSLSQGAKRFLAGQHTTTKQLKLHPEPTSDFLTIQREFFLGAGYFYFFFLTAVCLNA